MPALLPSHRRIPLLLVLLLAVAAARPGRGAEPRTLTGHTGWVGAVAFSPDGKTLATGGRDKAVRLWDVASALKSTP